MLVAPGALVAAGLGGHLNLQYTLLKHVHNLDPPWSLITMWWLISFIAPHLVYEYMRLTSPLTEAEKALADGLQPGTRAVQQRFQALLHCLGNARASPTGFPSQGVSTAAAVAQTATAQQTPPCKGSAAAGMRVLQSTACKAAASASGDRGALFLLEAPAPEACTPVAAEGGPPMHPDSYVRGGTTSSSSSTDLVATPGSSTLNEQGRQQQQQQQEPSVLEATLADIDTPHELSPLAGGPESLVRGQVYNMTAWSLAFTSTCCGVQCATIQLLCSSRCNRAACMKCMSSTCAADWQCQIIPAWHAI